MFLKIKNWFWKRVLKNYHCKLAFGIYTLGKNAELNIEQYVHLGRGLMAAEYFKMGAHSYIRSGFEIYGQCEIGRFCSIGQNVLIGLDKHQHPLDWLSTSLFTKQLEKVYRQEKECIKTSIGNDCWIGRDAVIMAGVKVGTGAVIGARAVVVKDVPPYAIVGGVPTKIIKYRFKTEIINKLLESEWWEFSTAYLEKLDFRKPEILCNQILNTSKDNHLLAKYCKIKITTNHLQIK
jgi:chloramphenicol O-acetyltransferase type B